MKFYYNGKLIRTSKNHTYTHAVISKANGRCLGCRANRANCESIINSEIHQYERAIEDLQERIGALDLGKTYYYVTFRGRSWKEKFTENDTVENYLARIKEYEEYIDHVKNTWKIVELEQK